MNTKRIRAAGIIAAGALLLSVMVPTAAHANFYDDYEGQPGRPGGTPIEGDLAACGKKDTTWHLHFVSCERDVYDIDKSKTYPFFGPASKVGEMVASCPGKGAMSVTVSRAHTTGSDWSWTVGGSVGFSAGVPGLMGSVTASSAYTRTTSTSSTNGNGQTASIPEGKLGWMVFSPLMNHTEGRLDWVEHWTPDSGRGQYWLKFAQTVINAPVVSENGAAEGVFYAQSRDLNPDERKGLCGLDY